MPVEKEKPDRPWGESIDHMIDDEHPLGFNYSKGDINFLAAMNDKFQRPIETSEVHIREQIYKDYKEAEKLNRVSPAVIEEIIRMGIHVRRISIEENSNTVFSLSYPPISLRVSQGERRTVLNFLSTRDRSYYLEDIYSLFFDKLPNSMQEKGPDTPTQEFLINNTTIDIATRSGIYKRKFELRKSSKKEEFERFFEEDQRDIVWLNMNVESDRGVSYRLILPNPISDIDIATQYSFPSRNVLTKETMGVLLSLHKDADAMEIAKDQYATTYSDAINVIRQRLRVK